MFDKEDRVGKMRCANQDFSIDEISSAFENVVINPVSGGIKEDNVTKFQSFLLEIDPDKEEWAKMTSDERGQELLRQKNYFLDKGLPVTAIVYSGNKSLHVIITLEQPLVSKQLWKFMRKWLQNIFPDADPNTSAVIGVRNYMHTRQDTGKSPKVLFVGKKIDYTDMTIWINKFPDCKPTNSRERSKSTYSKDYRDFVNEQRAGYGLEASKSHLSGFTKNFLMLGADEGERNRSTFRAACDMAKCGWDEDEALDRILEAVDLPQWEVERTVKSAFDKISEE